MKITLKLFATLGDLLPDEAVENAIEIDVPDSATPHEIIDRFNVPRSMAHLILHNGVYVGPAQRDRSMFKPGDVLAVWPPVAGG
ncbi:MAG: MoaD/ThiS family protein [Gammaproteobacteria bacterium]|nr:MoaD/ThiS family protein [Gammaproteobacteria bacterium]